MEGTLEDLGVNVKFDELPFGTLTDTSLIAAESLLRDIGSVVIFKTCYLYLDACYTVYFFTLYMEGL